MIHRSNISILLTKWRDREREKNWKKHHRKHSFIKIAIICLNNFLAEIDNETEKCFSQLFAWKLRTKSVRYTTNKKRLNHKWCCLQFKWYHTLLTPPPSHPTNNLQQCRVSFASPRNFNLLHTTTTIKICRKKTSPNTCWVLFFSQRQ